MVGIGGYKSKIEISKGSSRVSGPPREFELQVDRPSLLVKLARCMGGKLGEGRCHTGHDILRDPYQSAISCRDFEIVIRWQQVILQIGWATSHGAKWTR